MPAGLFPRYAAALMAFTALVVVGSGALQLYSIDDRVRADAAAIQRVEVGAAASRIEQFVAGIEAVLRESGAVPWTDPALPLQSRREEFHRLMKIVPAISAVRWIDAQGRERLYVSRIDMDRVDSGAEAGPVAAQAVAAKNGVAHGPTYFRDGSEPFFTLGIADRDRKGATLAEIDLKFVSDVVRGIRIGQRGLVYVVDGGNRLMAHPDEALVLRRTDLSRYAPLARLRSSLEGEGRPMIEGEGLTGGQVMVSGSLIAPVGWLAIAEQPRAEVLEPVYAVLWRTVFIVLGSLMLALMISYWLAHRLSRPVVELRRGAQRIGRGDLSARIDARTRDEVGELALEFNRMAGQLAEYTTGLEHKVAERTSELEAAMRARALFLAAASHDLRQPLYAISILADTLAIEPLDDAAGEVLAKQREAIAVLRTLFDNLLDLSRFDAGEVKPVPRVVALRELLATPALEAEVMCHAKGLAFHVEIVEAWVETDPDLVRRVASNLLSNAVRYTPAGRVSFTARVEGGYAVLTVTDSGIGIAEADRERIFGEFVQLANPGRDREKGVGLGLSIVKRICELMGTPIVMTSAPGCGSCFSLRVPLAPTAARGEREAPPVPAGSDAFKGAHVWVVEDDPLVRAALSMQLSAWGATCAFAASMAQVLAQREADGRWPDAALLDDMLGGGERGLEIASWLAARMPRDCIALVTGNVDVDRIAELEASGLEVLRKPLSSGDLARCLWKAIRAKGAATAVRDREPAG